MKFEIYQDSSRQWRWRLKAANGEKLASGEAYRNKDDCLTCIGSLMDTDRKTPVYEVAA
jgi:uncharacterized protein